jgi:hypothetical protein
LVSARFLLDHGTCKSFPTDGFEATVVWFGGECDSCVDPNRIAVLLFAQQDGQ